MMKLSRLYLLLALCAVGSLPAAPALKTSTWNTVEVEPASTSIYVGSVKLTTSEFRRSGDRFSATYEAKVWPWVFWNEHGDISITIPSADLDRLERGERVEFTGSASNHKHKPRTITGWAERHNPGTGKIKVRIGVDDTELIFNTTYRFPDAG